MRRRRRFTSGPWPRLPRPHEGGVLRRGLLGNGEALAGRCARAVTKPGSQAAKRRLGGRDRRSTDQPGRRCSRVRTGPDCTLNSGRCRIGHAGGSPMNSISDDGVTIGERLRALRLWRHMTLAEVAGLAGISAAYLSMAERGLRSVDRRSMISDLAAALRVSETELTGGPHLGSDPEQSAPHSAILALRVALETSSLADPADCYARSAVDLAAEMRAIKTLYYQRCDYVSVGERLPAVLDELHAQACAASDADRQAALGLLVEACITAGFMAKNLGY